MEAKIYKICYPSYERAEQCFLLRKKIFVDSGLTPGDGSDLEMDDYDKESKHFFIMEQGKLDPVGVGRIIVNNPPFKEGIKLYDEFKFLYTEDVCEISRIGSLTRGALSTLVVAAFTTIYRENRIHYIGVMEPALPRLLNSFGCTLAKAGDDQVYQGRKEVRAPYYGYFPTVMSNMSEKNPKLFNRLQKELFG